MKLKRAKSTQTNTYKKPTRKIVCLTCSKHISKKIIGNSSSEHFIVEIVIVVICCALLYTVLGIDHRRYQVTAYCVTTFWYQHTFQLNHITLSCTEKENK